MTMLLAGAAAALLAVSAPSANAPKDRPAADQSAKPADTKAEKNKSEPFDPIQLMAMFDKLFPPQPDPDPARLALARTAVTGLFPEGTYSRAMDGMMDSFMDRIFSMSEADFGKKDDKGKPASTVTLREQMMKEDPHFEERMKITQRVIGEEMAKLAVIIEPRLREGVARSIARRLDAKQLSDLNAFLATDSGRAYGAQSMMMWFDGDVMRSVMNSFPELIVAMPAAMKRVEEATAHLPKPKKAEEKKEDKEE